MVNDLFLLAFPLVAAGIIHMVIVKLNLICALNIPLSTKLFGANKTYRGFVVMPLASMFAVHWSLALVKPISINFKVIDPNLLGIYLGLAYCLAELPNSFIKRKLGITPGELPENKKLLFAIIDQADSVVGCAIAYMIILGISWKLFGILIILGTVLHLLINLLLFALKLRKNPL